MEFEFDSQHHCHSLSSPIVVSDKQLCSTLSIYLSFYLISHSISTLFTPFAPFGPFTPFLLFALFALFAPFGPMAINPGFGIHSIGTHSLVCPSDRLLATLPSFVTSCHSRLAIVSHSLAHWLMSACQPLYSHERRIVVRPH